jgi:hypothetical protein
VVRVGNGERTLHEVLVRKTEVPSSNEKLPCALSTLALFEIVILPGLLLYMNAW